MNKVTTVNLDGNAFQLEENGYDALRAYLEEASRRLANNPDREEILADIERAIAEKFRALLGKYKSVVLAKEVQAVIAEMGSVQDESIGTSDASAAAGAAGSAEAKSSASAGAGAGAGAEYCGPPRRLYKIPEGAMIAGVCNGFAVYLNVDVVLVRIVFAAFSLVLLLIGLFAHILIFIPALIYIILALALPAAHTAAERAAARGDPLTAQEYIRRAKQGYYDSVKAIRDHAKRNRWRYDFKWDDHDSSAGWSQANVDPWSANPARALAPSFALPVLGLAEFGLLLFGLWAIIHLITNGAVFGVALPANVPLWIGIVVILFAYQIISWPLKALRFACYQSLTGRPVHAPFFGFLDSMIWLAVAVASVWLADRYIPQVHEFILALPAKIDHASQAVQQWWASRHG